jgi:hypothetical protein
MVPRYLHHIYFRTSFFITCICVVCYASMQGPADNCRQFASVTVTGECNNRETSGYSCKIRPLSPLC